MSKTKVAILGATGAVGQRFVQLLADHPWFEVAEVVASDRSAGKPYREACTWRLPGGMPDAVGALVVKGLDAALQSKLLFSGLDSSVAGDAEASFASRGHAVVSNSRNHRMAEDVPLLIPEVNPSHLDAIPVQRRRTGAGYIVTNPNCSVVGLAMALGPLHRAFGVEAVAVVTLQALSGAGYPGVASLDISDNVIPFIGGGEEEKIESEPQKILGDYVGGSFRPAEIVISSSVHRVAVADGHTMAAFLKLRRKASPAQAAEVLAGFRGEPQERGLPFAPKNAGPVRPSRLDVKARQFSLWRELASQLGCRPNPLGRGPPKPSSQLQNSSIALD